MGPSQGLQSNSGPEHDRQKMERMAAYALQDLEMGIFIAEDALHLPGTGDRCARALLQSKARTPWFEGTHAHPLAPWHPPPHNVHLSSTLALLRVFKQLTTPPNPPTKTLVLRAEWNMHVGSKVDAWSISAGLLSLQGAASKNRELLDWLEALAYDTKEFIEEDEKKELKEIHLKIKEHKADFVWLLEEDSQLARKLQKNVGEFLKELG